MDDIQGRIRGGSLRGSPTQARQPAPQRTPTAGNANNTNITSSTTAHKLDNTTDKPPKNGRSRKKTVLLLAAGGTLIVVLAATSIFFFWQHKNNSTSAEDDAAATSQRVIEQVSDLYILPTDEEPTVAEIRDKDRLSDQAFFDNAENGDYLLVYEQAGVALIYRESVGKLVNVSPVGIGSNEDIAGSQQEADMNDIVPSSPEISEE